MRRRTTLGRPPAREAKASLEQQVQTILARSMPLEARPNLEHFLSTVMLFTKETLGQRLTEEEKAYPPHPDFLRVIMQLRRPEAVEGILRRLNIIYRYSVTDAQRIIDLLTSLSSYPSRAFLSGRKAQILLELHQSPDLHQNELAERLSVTPRTIAKELRQLRRDFSFQMTRYYDPQKFRLTICQIVFQTKSLKSSEELDQLLRTHRPTLLRRLAFDADLHRGYLIYEVPDQPKPRKMFEDRVRELADEYFEEHRVARWLGFHVSLSFDAYDTKKGTWVLEADAVFEALQRLAERRYDALVQPRGILFGAPIDFDRIDYLLAASHLTSSEPKALELKQALLKQNGFDLSTKTIWAREQRLYKSEAFFTTIYYDIPHFEELVHLSVDCSPDAREGIRLIPSMLPYTFIIPTDSGITLILQRPTLYAALAGEMVRAISRWSGVSDVVTTSVQETFTGNWGVRFANRWDEGHQRWTLEDGDL